MENHCYFARTAAGHFLSSSSFYQDSAGFLCWQSHQASSGWRSMAFLPLSLVWQAEPIHLTCSAQESPPAPCFVSHQDSEASPAPSSSTEWLPAASIIRRALPKTCCWDAASLIFLLHTFYSSGTSRLFSPGEWSCRICHHTSLDLDRSMGPCHFYSFQTSVWWCSSSRDFVVWDLHLLPLNLDRITLLEEASPI